MPSFKPQIGDLDTWTEKYLAYDEPLPTTVRNSTLNPQVSEFIYFFGTDKTFGLTGTIGLTDNPTGPLPTTAELFAYLPGSKQPRYSLGWIKEKDINEVGGATIKFGEDVTGSFNLYIRVSDVGARQVWGHIQAIVSGRPFDQDLYLCPITPPAQNPCAM